MDQKNQTTRRTFSAPWTSLRMRMTLQTRPQSVSFPAAEVLRC